MKLKNKRLFLEGKYGRIELARNREGVPEITAGSAADLAFGLGFVHANDRQLQTLLTRTLLKGQAAEKLSGDPALIEIDKFMRRMNFLADPEAEIRKLEPGVREQLEAYAAGFNLYLSRNKPVFEMRLLGYRPEPWEVKDCLLIGKAFGFIGLVDAQGAMEKFLIQCLQNGVAEDKIRELFPYLTEAIDHELLKKVRLAPPLIPEAVRWLDRLPGFTASNNWAVAGRRTVSGHPILCGDPHLEVNRLPAIWQEIVMRRPENVLLGATIPGLPGLILGRTSHLAWSATYSFMDMIDYRIEHCTGGRYERKDGWKPFRVREEVIKVKKGDPIRLKVYENEQGLLEGDPEEEGYLLVLAWSGRENSGAGEFNGLLKLPEVRTVREAMECFKKLEASTFNWVIADTQGNIGYQMSGRLFDRPPGVSGLLPLPGWEEKYDPRSYVDPDRLPSLYNPEDGLIVTANEDLNHLGPSRPITLPMAGYRSQRIRHLLEAREKLDLEYMKTMHYDLYSLQAERFLEVIGPLLPETPNGRALKDWDRRYEAESKGAMLFESVYRALLDTVFGDGGLGREVVAHVLSETGLFHDYYGNLDDILLEENSAWFGGRDRGDLFRQAIEEGLAVEAVPYGSTRKITLNHLLFGGRFPRFLGFDRGPLELPGSRATITQGQIFKSAGRLTTFSPSLRFMTDMGEARVYSMIAGGPSDRRFSRWYANDLGHWLNGVYKVLE
ncbi:MAG: penicillin acylase family protein [Thermodesulfobacteriota bacterium]